MHVSGSKVNPYSAISFFQSDEQDPNRMENMRTWFVSLFVMLLSGSHATPQLSTDFYASTCPRAEDIARRSLRRQFLIDPTAPASMLRLAFHDCQVEACDASILLDTIPNVMTGERVSGGNFGIRRLDIIDSVKRDLENECPSTVSCADIVAMAGRDSVSFAGGPAISIAMGRKDALSASNLDADAQLPPASSSVNKVIDVFNRYGMNLAESVAILGAHTIGVGHCVNVVDRLYPTRDPALSTGLYMQLRALCPTERPVNVTIIPNDLTNLSFDNRYFKDLLGGRGLFKVDANLVGDPRTNLIVQDFASNQSSFYDTFSTAFVKMVSAKVLTGNQGEVRSNCRRVN